MKFGFCNLKKHIENIRQFEIEPEVEINFMIDVCDITGIQLVIFNEWANEG